jgi:hypothetical protein
MLAVPEFVFVLLFSLYFSFVVLSFSPHLAFIFKPNSSPEQEKLPQGFPAGPCLSNTTLFFPLLFIVLSLLSFCLNGCQNTVPLFTVYANSSLLESISEVLVMWHSAKDELVSLTTAPTWNGNFKNSIGL